MSNNRFKIGGFTVVEILIVVIIISIAAMMALPMFSSAAVVQARAAADMIAADIEYAKNMAISMGQNYSVEFDSTAESYRIKDQVGSTIPHPVKLGFDYEIDFGSDSRLNKVEIVSVSFNGTNEVKFDYLGSPYDSAGGVLNSGLVTLQAGDTVVEVSVEPVTGYVSIN